MAAKKKPKATDGLPPTADYRHEQKRTNIPSAKIAGEGQIPKAKKVQYSYSPHLDPVLRFDPTGRADKVAAIVEKVCRGERLDSGEQEILRAVGKNWEQPWLEWAGKQEEHARGSFAVDPVALHIHERISAQAILRAAQRQDAQRSLFADPEHSYSESLKFYKHDVDWANRLILGDSLQVMSSLAHRENLAGKVKFVYIDPPYGIRFASNFQPEIDQLDIRDGKDADFTREPEMVRAFRDTWKLGVASYLSYMRLRLSAARDMICSSGSVCVQISDENLHRMRLLLDDVFGASNSIAIIAFQKTGGFAQSFMASSCDYILWYAKDRGQFRPRSLYVALPHVDPSDPNYRMRELPDGSWTRMSSEARSEPDGAHGQRVFRFGPMTSDGAAASSIELEFQGRVYHPKPGSHWKTNASGLGRLDGAARLIRSGAGVAYKMYWDDYAAERLGSQWADTQSGGFNEAKVYVVQTTNKVIERCVLMATEPGDLVLDPTSGSGTTAVAAEKWGRRWIAIDTSRVALSIARQRLLTAKFDHYRTTDGPQSALGAENPGSGFKYKTVPHITLGAIAQNQNLDPIFAKHEPILTAKLEVANAALASMSAELRAKLKAKLAAKQSSDGKKSVTDADRRRWILPPENRDPRDGLTVDVKFAGWYDWEVPFDIDHDWPKPLQDAVTAYRAAWRAKMEEVNKCISDNADPEELVDQPDIVSGVVRVTGPFTVEGVIPEEMSLTEDGIRDLTPNTFDEDARTDEQNNQAYLDLMVQGIRRDGVLFLGNKKKLFARVEPLYGTQGLAGLHAEAAWEGEDDLKVAIAFGPQYGPVTAHQVENLIRASRRYEHLVIAAFSFAPEASAIISENPHPRLQVHMAHIRPDVNPAMQGLLKDTPNSQLFTVFGLPAIGVIRDRSGEYSVELEGVDIYDPVENTVRSTKAEKVAAWFLDSDFDGRCFCVTQAFFPNQDAWEKIRKALKAEADLDVFEAFQGTISLPFKAGKHATIAVKVIDPRGNEVMTVKKLES